MVRIVTTDLNEIGSPYRYRYLFNAFPAQNSLKQ